MSRNATTVATHPEWDVFISHASEDKATFVQPLAEALKRAGFRVWYDRWTLTVGDSLRKKIDEGLSKSRFGIVVISHSFFAKDWPQRELDGLVSLEVGGRKVILPVWHGVTQSDVARYSPTLAGRLAARSSDGIDGVVDQLSAAITIAPQQTAPLSVRRPAVSIDADRMYMGQRSTLSDTPIVQKLFSRSRWRIWIRPIDFKKARFRDVVDCRAFAESSYIPANGRLFPYPYITAGTFETGDEWIVCETDIAGNQIAHTERWALFRSGQFLHYVALDETPQLGGRIHVLEILDTVTAVVEFAARMAKRHVLSSDAALTVELFGVDGLQLTWPKSVVDYANLVEFRGWCQDQNLFVERSFSSEDIQSKTQEIGLEIALEIYSKFGWVNPPVQRLQEEQLRRFP